MNYPLVRSAQALPSALFVGSRALVNPAEAFGKMIVAETEKWEQVVKAAGIKVE